MFDVSKMLEDILKSTTGALQNESFETSLAFQDPILMDMWHFEDQVWQCETMTTSAAAASKLSSLYD